MTILGEVKAKINEVSNSNTETKFLCVNARRVIERLDGITESIVQRYIEGLIPGSNFYRLQPGDFGGNSVFFNPNGSDTRYGLNDNKNGTMYLAVDPVTAMNEVFQNRESMMESDLAGYYMGQIETIKLLKILDLGNILPIIKLTTHDVTTAVRSITQLLAKRVHACGADGMRYISNVNQRECLVLWSDLKNCNNIAKTVNQTCLSQFKYKGELAADIIVYQLNISVEE